MNYLTSFDLAHADGNLVGIDYYLETSAFIFFIFDKIRKTGRQMDTKNLTLVIIDDEQDAREVVRSLLNDLCPDIQVLGEAEDVPSGIELIRKAQPNVVLLDIQMGNNTGFELLDQFGAPGFQVIFYTAYDQFALKAIKYAALDYLVKPIDPKELVKAMERARLNLFKEQFSQLQIRQLIKARRTKTIEKITLHTTEGLVFLRLKDILYLQSDVNYTQFFTSNNEKVMVSKTLKYFEEILPKEDFCRVHQSYILNVHSVRKVLREDGGYALLENGKKIPISRRKKETFLKLIT